MSACLRFVCGCFGIRRTRGGNVANIAFRGDKQVADDLRARRKRGACSSGESATAADLNRSDIISLDTQELASDGVTIVCESDSLVVNNRDGKPGLFGP